MLWKVPELGDQFAQRAPQGWVSVLWGALVRWERQNLGPWEAWALAHPASSGMQRSTLVLFTCVYFEAYMLLAWVRLNWFLAQLDRGLTSSVGPTWGVGDAISGERCCVVGQIHSCSEVRPDCWWGPKRHWLSKDQPGAGMVACDFQHDSKPSPELVGLASDFGQRNDSFA